MVVAERAAPRGSSGGRRADAYVWEERAHQPQLPIALDRVRGIFAQPPRPARWERGATVRQAPAALPRDKFARVYLDEYRTLKWIAEHADVNVDAIKVLAPRPTGRWTHLPRDRRGDRLLRRDDQLSGPAARHARWPNKGQAREKRKVVSRTMPS